jgi:hypothetical protein
VAKNDLFFFRIFYKFSGEAGSGTWFPAPDFDNLFESA